jgi:hypothetical protein
MKSLNVLCIGTHVSIEFSGVSGQRMRLKIVATEPSSTLDDGFVSK